jgi:hypothetical protein
MDGSDLECSAIAHPYLGGFMAKIIEFYVPSSFRKKATKRTASEQRGKVLPFASPQRKSA